jgi:hypothetical protein
MIEIILTSARTNALEVRMGENGGTIEGPLPP